MEKKRLGYLYLSLLFLVLFVATLVLVKIEFFNSSDIAINSFFKSIEFGFGIKFMSFISFFGSTLIVGIFSLLLLAFFYWRHKIQDGFFYVFNFIFGEGLGYLVKETVQRVRPPNPFETDFSFPSGHVLAAALICFSLSYLMWKNDKKIAITILFLPLLMAISRLYLNVHWFSDVLGSLFLAGFMFSLSVFVFWRYLQQI